MGRRHRDRKLVEHENYTRVLKSNLNSEDNQNESSQQPGRSRAIQRGRVTIKKENRKQLLDINEEDYDTIDDDEFYYSNCGNYYNDEQKCDGMGEDITQNGKKIEDDNVITMQLYHLMLAEEEQDALKITNREESNKNYQKMKNDVIKENIKSEGRDDDDDEDDNDGEWTTSINIIVQTFDGDSSAQQRKLSMKKDDEWSIVSDIPSVYSLKSEFLLTYSDALRLGQKVTSNNNQKVQTEKALQEEELIATKYLDYLDDITHDAEFIRDGVKYSHGGGVKFRVTEQKNINDESETDES